jgi:hypothetical protein
MTISSTNRRAGPYSGNGSQTAFPFSFKVFQASDMLVVKVQVSTNIETTLTLTTDYTVALNADQNSNAGGNINMVTALPTGYKIVISSKVEYLQETDLTNQGGFYPEVITDALDRLTIEAQQLKEGLDRAAQLPITSSADAASLVADIVRIADSADNLDTVATNIDDVNTVADDISDVNTVAGIAANVTTVAGIASNVTTVAGIAANVTSVAGNAANINAVAANETNIDAVAANETNIDAVAANETNIDTVAGISSAVSAVAADATDIGTVATNIADVNTVADGIADINTCADNMAAIIDAPAQASAAAASAAAAAASLDNFDDRYLGSKSSAPTLDNDGNALAAGALYFNDGTIVSDDKGMYVYDGGTWIAASAASQAILVKYKYIATAGQTTFSGADANSLTLSYTAGSIIVTLNGVVMDAADYTATSGNSIVLGVAAALNDELGVFAFSTFDIANTYTQAQVDAFAVKLTGDQTVAGVKTFSSAPVMSAGAKLSASGWSVTETGNVLYFAFDGTNKAKLDSSGNLTVVGNVTAYGTV